MRHLRNRLLALCLGLLLAWLIVEGVIVTQNRDVAAIQQALYYQSVQLQIHQPDPMLRLRYGLRPNSKMGESTIGETGLRNPTPPDDAEGPRILFGGGSTVFGSRIHDDETLPARLGHHLGGAAVWNLGVSAYVEAQVLDRCRQWLERLDDVDLIIVMITNPGRRPFLLDNPPDRRTLREALWHDPGFIEENLPPPWGESSRDLHSTLTRISPAWRYITAVRASQLPAASPLRLSHTARQLAAEQLRVAAAAADVPVVYVHYPRHNLLCEGCWRGDLELNLERPGLTPQDGDLHPPAHVLDAHAQVLAQQLKDSGILPSLSVTPSP